MSWLYIVSLVRYFQPRIVNSHLAGYPEFIFLRSLGGVFYGGQPWIFN